MTSRLLALVLALVAGCQTTSSEPPKPAPSATSESPFQVTATARLEAVDAGPGESYSVTVYAPDAGPKPAASAPPIGAAPKR